MVRKVVTIAIDKNFFTNLFEKERIKMQKKIGISNLTQPNFSKMITGLKIRQPKQDFSHVNTRIKKKNVKI